MGTSWYSGFDDSGQQPYWDSYYKWLEGNAPKAGKYYKSIMKDPANSTLATAAHAATARAQKLAEQNYTVDPEIAAHPELLAAKLNEQKQDIASEGATGFLNALAGVQTSMYGQNLQRRLSNYGTMADAKLRELLERIRMTRGVQKTNPLLGALGAAAPFLGLIPGVGPALSAGAGAAGAYA